MMAAMNREHWLIARFDGKEYRVCRSLNRAARWPWFLAVMRCSSRLGDGGLWVALIVALPLLYGSAAIRVALAMAVTGLGGYLIYKSLKATLVRERPFIRHPDIDMAISPLDRYSFPSGHTLHAVSFVWQAVAHYPQLGWILVPAASLIAISRVVLGLHYPTDVVAGAAIGAVLAGCGLALA
jgi:undecaprenyl-diphosphatase